MSQIDEKIIGSSEAANNLKQMITLVAPSDSAVIINGPTGAGKELVAEALHDASRRKGKFIAVNCAAIANLRATGSRFQRWPIPNSLVAPATSESVDCSSHGPI